MYLRLLIPLLLLTVIGIATPLQPPHPNAQRGLPIPSPTVICMYYREKIDTVRLRLSIIGRLTNTPNLDKTLGPALQTAGCKISNWTYTEETSNGDDWEASGFIENDKPIDWIEEVIERLVFYGNTGKVECTKGDPDFRIDPDKKMIPVDGDCWAEIIAWGEKQAALQRQGATLHE